jgi:hypothetical protein
MSPDGRLGEFANGRFVEAQFANGGIGRTAATEKPRRLQWVACGRLLSEKRDDRFGRSADHALRSARKSSLAQLAGVPEISPAGLNYGANGLDIPAIA